MNEVPNQPAPDSPAAILVVRRRIEASPEQLFAAWTEPKQLLRWWGPQGVTCVAAELDLRVGGAYRLDNRMPDGTVLRIVGVFEAIEPPVRLVYSWSLGGAPGPLERVTVRFERRGSATEVTVMHERIANEAARTGHERGWIGCLEGLAELFEHP